MELLKKHSTCKVNKDMCLGIAQALADTFNNSTTSCSTTTQVDAKPESSTCTCNKSGKLSSIRFCFKKITKIAL